MLESKLANQMAAVRLALSMSMNQDTMIYFDTIGHT